MIKLPLAIAAALATLILAEPRSGLAQSLPRGAQCDISFSESDAYNGPCLFKGQPEKGVGSFTVSREGGQPLIRNPRGYSGGSIYSVLLVVKQPGVADGYRGVVGQTMPLGEFKRAKGTRGCWVMQDDADGESTGTISHVCVK